MSCQVRHANPFQDMSTSVMTRHKIGEVLALESLAEGKITPGIVALSFYTAEEAKTYTSCSYTPTQ